MKKSIFKHGKIVQDNQNESILYHFGTEFAFFIVDGGLVSAAMGVFRKDCYSF
jgi:hypothetical protein